MACTDEQYMGFEPITRNVLFQTTSCRGYISLKYKRQTTLIDIEKHLRKLLAEQRKQLDAIKKATNYDSTRKLIELYDEHSPASASPSPQQLPQRQKQVSSNPVTPVRQGQAPVPGLGTGPSKPSPKGTPRAPGHLVGVGGTPQAGQSIACLSGGKDF